MKHLRSYALAILVLCLLVGWGTQDVAAQVPDPAVPGPRQVIRAEYNLGLIAFTPTGFPGPVELLASVHYPIDLSGGPLPLVIILHGRHPSCFTGGTALTEWPCSLSSPIPNYMGYDYAASLLASHGFIVVSISANGITARDNLMSDRGALARAELIQKHLDIWRTFNTTGGAPFCNRFVGKVDLQRVATMGHSRGGEGVVRHFQLNQAQGSPYGIKAVFALAPTDFNRAVINRVPLGVLLPYCDGDVNDLQGVHYYDDARYNVAGDPAAKHTVLVLGGNHNFYNTVWTPGLFVAGTADDWNAFIPGGAGDSHCGGGGRLNPSQQQATAKAYLSAFFRTYLKNETQFLPLLTSAAQPPASAQTNNIHVSYHAPDTPTMRRDINRLLTGSNLSINTLGGAVSQSGLSPYDLCGGDSPQPIFCTSLPSADGFRPHEPHVTPSLSSTMRGLSQLRFGWSSAAARYDNALPTTASNLFGFGTLSFRATVNFTDTRNMAGQPQNLRVELVDGAGATSAVRVSDHSRALFYPPGQTPQFLPRLVQNTVHVPLTAFTGVNLADIRTVRLKLDQQSSGALLMSDLAVVATPGVPTPTPTPSPTPTRCDVSVSPDPLSLISFGSFLLDSGVMTAQTAPFPCLFVADQSLLQPPISAFPITDLLLPFDQWFVFDNGGPIPFSPFTAFGSIGFVAFNGVDVTFKEGTIILTVFDSGGGPLFTDPVLGGPVTGEYSTTKTKPMPDGTTSTQTSTSLFYRDRQGRIRQERGDVVTITDPVAGVKYVLDMKKQTAHRVTINTGNRNAAAPGEPPTGPNTTTLSESRSLGTQRLEGVEAMGKEYVSVIPAGSKLGNNDAVQMTYELWQSKALQLPLMVRIKDALTGETSIRFKILQKGVEPDAKLFAVPEGYRVVDAVPVTRRGEQP